MNCDQAFDCLTDSTRRHSPQLQEHLAHCERCRQMHDTLEPALDMFDELIPEPDLSNCRAATQTLAPEAVRVAEQSASRLLSAGAPSPPSRRGLILRYAAAAMAGALLMGVMGSINDVQPPESSTDQPGLADAASSLPAVHAPPERSTPTPAPEQASCEFLSQTIDRQVAPTAIAVVRRCANCHRDPEAPLFPASAQPISIELPADLDETADLIVRALRVRERSLFLATSQAVPRRNSAQIA